MSKVYLGSLNNAKIAAVSEVFKDYKVECFQSDSNVSYQPIGDDETILGALNRALNLPHKGLRIGLEGGITLVNEMLFLINWGVMIDETGKVYYAGGTRIPIPDQFKVLLTNRDLELATLIDEYVGKTNVRNFQGAIGVFTNNYVQRKDIFLHICKLLYGQYLYQKTLKKSDFNNQITSQL